MRNEAYHLLLGGGVSYSANRRCRCHGIGIDTISHLAYYRLSEIHFARQQEGDHTVVCLRAITPRNYFSESLYFICHRQQEIIEFLWNMQQELLEPGRPSLRNGSPMTIFPGNWPHPESKQTTPGYGSEPVSPKDECPLPEIRKNTIHPLGSPPHGRP